VERAQGKNGRRAQGSDAYSSFRTEELGGEAV
jgi:hypothetical protein